MSHETNEFGQPIGRLLPNWKPPAFPARTLMEGRFCRLEPLDPKAHAGPLWEANSLDADGRMWTYLPYGPFATVEDYSNWLVESAASQDPLFFAVVERTRDVPVGLASYLRINPEAGSIEVGHLAYSPLLQRTPAATEAMYLMMQRAFELGYRRYEWKCNAFNAPSRAAAQRLGLSFEGVFRQFAVTKGRTRDTAWYAAIDEEWPALNEAFTRWLDPTNFDERGNQRQRLSTWTGPILKQRG
jgi:RimJ/RimL family protein N-acetyltransferase